LRTKVGAVGVMIDGKANPPKPPEPSDPQRWLSIAAKDDLLADALRYFGRGDDWLDIYKALECLELRFGGETKLGGLGWASGTEIKLLKHNANYKRRHARLKY